MRIGVLTVSDRVATGEMEDAGGPAVEAALAEPGWEVAARAVVPDEKVRIAEILVRWSDVDRLDVVFSTGGTGFSPRDVTPEATLSVAERLAPGVAEAMRADGLRKTPHAMLSRGAAAIRGSTLIINLPGSPRGAAEGVAVVQPVLEHAVAILKGAKH